MKIKDNAIQYYDNFDKAIPFDEDYCVSYNKDHRINDFLHKINYKSLLDAACTYPQALYDDFINIIRGKHNVHTVFLGSGSEDIIFRINQKLQSYKFGIVAPNFYRIFETCNQYIIIDEKSKDNFGLITDVSHIKKSISEKMVDAVWLSNPNPILGFGFDKQSILDLVDEYPETLFLIDQANLFFSEHASNMDLCEDVTRHNNLAVIQTFSKYYSVPGLRVAFCATENKKLIKALSNNQVFGVSSMSITLLKELIENDELFSLLKNEIVYNRNSLLEHIENINLIKAKKTITNTIYLYSSDFDISSYLYGKGIYAMNLTNEIGIKDQYAARISVFSDPKMFQKILKAVISL